MPEIEPSPTNMERSTTKCSNPDDELNKKMPLDVIEIEPTTTIENSKTKRPNPEHIDDGDCDDDEVTQEMPFDDMIEIKPTNMMKKSKTKAMKTSCEQRADDDDGDGDGDGDAGIEQVMEAMMMMMRRKSKRKRRRKPKRRRVIVVEMSDESSPYSYKS